MKKFVLSIFTATLVFSVSQAQTLEELKAQKAEKNDSIADIQKRVDALQGEIDAFPGWKKGAFGTIGANISGFNNWYGQEVPNNSSGNIGATINLFANLNREKYFWRNSANINLKWVKLDDKDDPNDNDNFEGTTDVFNVTSLYGYKLSKSFAASALAEYRTTIINNFSDPGYLDVGIGATWTPIADLVVVIHPLNYNFVFSSEGDIFESSAGTKVVADYTKKLGKINVKSNLSAFLSYKSSDYSNWTWINSFGYTLWKGIGLGFEFGLRNNKQETLNYVVNNAPTPDPTATFDSIDNDLQTYWLFGLNYSF